MANKILDTNEALSNLEQVPLPKEDAVAFFRATQRLDVSGPSGSAVIQRRIESKAVLSEYTSSISHVYLAPALLQVWRDFLLQFPDEPACQHLLERIEKLVAKEVTITLPDAVFIGG